MAEFWAVPAEQPSDRRSVELVHGPRDGAVVEVGHHVTELRMPVESEGRYRVREDGGPNRFFWDPAVGA